MAFENITNISEIKLGLIDILPQDVVSSLDKLIFVSKIAVYLFIGYIVFLLIKQFYGWRRNRRINSIYYKIEEIDKKLDLLLDIEKIKLKKNKDDDNKKLKGIKDKEKDIKKKKSSFWDIFRKKKSKK